MKLYPNIVIVSEDSILIPEFMHFLSSHVEKGISFIWISPKRSTFIYEVERTLMYYCFLQGFYEKEKHLKINTVSVQKPEEIEKLKFTDNNLLLALPCEYEKGDYTTSTQDINVVFPDKTIEILEHIEQSHHLTISEEFLETILLTPSLSNTNYFNEDRLTSEVQKLLELEENTPLLSDPQIKQQYYMLLDMMPWKTTQLVEKCREELDVYISKAIANPTEDNLHFFLLLFKRRLSENFSYPVLLDSLYPRGECIQILEPVKNWKIKVILPTYNKLTSFKRTVESILNQSYSNWEIIIIDHASTDGTHAYCQKLSEQDPRIKVITKTVNKGAKELCSYYSDIFSTLDTELIVSCPDDDWLEPDHFQEHITILRKYPWAAMVYGGYTLVKKDATPCHQYGPLYNKTCIVNPFIELERVLLAGVFPQCCLIRAEILKTFRQWDTTAPKDCEYGINDFSIGIYMPSLFEVAHIPKHLLNITSDTSSANAQCDNSDRWLSILTSLVRCHKNLFGEGNYPHKSLIIYYNMMLRENLQNIHKLMTHESTLETDPEIAEKLLTLSGIHQFAQEKMAFSNKYVDHLFEGKNAFRTLN